MKCISIILFLCTFLNTYSSSKPSIFPTNYKLDTVILKDLTNDFLWNYYFKLNENFDSLMGPLVVIEPKLKFYPFFGSMIKQYREDYEIFQHFPDTYSPAEASHSFFIDIPDKFRDQIVLATQIEAPHRIFPGNYRQLSPLIPTPVLDHYLFIEYKEWFGSRKLIGYFIQNPENHFKVISREVWWWSENHSTMYKSYLDLARWREVGYTEDPFKTWIERGEILDRDFADNQNNFYNDADTVLEISTNIEDAIMNQIDDLLCLILENIYHQTPDNQRDYEVFPVVNILNHSNPRLDYMMNYLLKYLPDTLGSYLRNAWEVPEGILCNNDRSRFLNNLPWDFDTSCIYYCIYAPPPEQFNASMSSVYFTEYGGINILFDFHFHWNRMEPHFYFIAFDYNADSQSFKISKAEFLSGDLRLFFLGL